MVHWQRGERMRRCACSASPQRKPPRGKHPWPKLPASAQKSLHREIPQKHPPSIRPRCSHVPRFQADARRHLAGCHWHRRLRALLPARRESRTPTMIQVLLSPADSLSQAMHAGVIRDYEQQRLKRERQADFEMQRALEEEYRKVQTVSDGGGPPPQQRGGTPS